MKNIVMIGLSGSGKSTLGKELAKIMGMGFADMDEIIEAQQSTTIKELFAARGEAFFRDVEAKTAQRVSKMENMVISTGGGVVLRGDNIVALRGTGLVVFLDRHPDDISKDLACDFRPLLAAGKEQLYKMSRQRRRLYLAAADLVFPNNAPVEEAARKLRDLIRTQKSTGQYLVIGDPIGHTLSPFIHNTVFSALGFPAHYTARPVAKGETGEFMKSARAQGIKGFNVTAPHKGDIIPHLDEVDQEALLCQAVNTVVLQEGKYRGYNTDMQGLLLAVKGCGHEYKNCNIAILGTGGAAGGIALKAARESAAEIRILGRRPQAAAEIANHLEKLAPRSAFSWGDLSLPSIKNAMSGCDILFNTIPPTANGQQAFPSYGFLEGLPGHTLVCDLIYNPPCTALLLAAEALGLKVLNGLAMLIYQAILADEYYTGQTLNREALYQTVEKAMAL